MANSPVRDRKRVMMNVNEVAQFLHAHPGTVRNWIRQGKIPAKRVGELGNYIIYQDELEAAIESEPLNNREQE